MTARSICKLPTQAQAMLLGCIADHAADGDEVLAGVEEGRSAVCLYVELLGSQVDPRQTPMSVGLVHYGATDILLRYATLARASAATWLACCAAGWVDDTRKRQVTTPCIGVAWRSSGKEWEVTLACADLTDDGRIALGLWRQAKLAAPPAPAPRLTGRDREIVELADRATRLGFKLAPCSDLARADARRLKREGWITRGHIGASVSSVEASPMGQVDVHPAGADVAS